MRKTTKLFTLIIMSVAMSINAEEKVFPGADEQTPSFSHYFSWINNTNEGSTEEQTLLNLDFFRWLHDEYGMQLDIYAFDAGNIDGPGYAGSMESDKFKSQFPNGFDPIYEKAKSFGCRLGVWLGPDGYGETPEEEEARKKMLETLCEKYEFHLFKVDAVCGQLREEKQEAFADTMQRCRKHSPDLIVLNHRLDLGIAMPHATTFLWEGVETYIDVHLANTQTAPHHRAGALSRGLVPDLQRLTEDHGVCISSCNDFWDDDLVLQAFNRSLILAPETYGSPWFLTDEQFPKLARIYNLHKRYRDILTKGIVLPEESYGPNAVSRGDDSTRFVTLRNLTWTPVTYKVTLGQEIGLTDTGEIELRRFHPTECMLGTYQPNDVVEVEVAPFRSYMLIASTQPTKEVTAYGCDYEVVCDKKDKDIVVKLFGDNSKNPTVRVNVPKDEYSKAFLDGVDVTRKLKKDKLTLKFTADAPKNAIHRKLSDMTISQNPTFAEGLYEATCFAADNNALEIRTLDLSGKTENPVVKKARDAFINQPLLTEKGVWDKFAFDGDMQSSFKVCRRWEKYGYDYKGGMLRINTSKPTAFDRLIIEIGDENYVPTVAEASNDLINWKKLSFNSASGKVEVFNRYATPYQYIRIGDSPIEIKEIYGQLAGNKIEPKSWRASNLFTHKTSEDVQKTWTAKVKIDQYIEGSYLAIPVEGKHGIEGAYAAVKMGDKLIGTPDRSVSFPSNVWEYRVVKRDSNYTYYVPVTKEMVGKELEVFVMGYDAENLEFNPEVWITRYGDNIDSKTLVLKR